MIEGPQSIGVDPVLIVTFSHEALHWPCERRGGSKGRHAMCGEQRLLPPVKRFGTALTSRLLITNRVLCHFKAHFDADQRLPHRRKASQYFGRSARPKNATTHEFHDYCERRSNLFHMDDGGFTEHPLARHR